MSREGKRTKRPGGGLDVAGLAMALLLASRFVGPVMRGLGPAGRHLAVVVVGVTLPAGVGYTYWQRRKDERRLAEERARRARVRLGAEDATTDPATDAATDPATDAATAADGEEAGGARTA